MFEMFVMEEKMLKLITFQNQLFSPNKFKRHVEKGFSSQIIPGKTDLTTAEAEEPTSPKVSCIGRMKHKSKQKENKKIMEGQKAKESYLSIFFVKPQEKRFSVPRPHPKVPARASHAPDLGHLRRYASAHNTLNGFDWRAPSKEDREGENEVIIPFSSPVTLDDLRGICGTANVELKSRKEVNLWKRRTIAQPRSLQVAPLRI